MGAEHRTDADVPPRPAADDSRSATWVARAYGIVLGGVAGAPIGLLLGATGFALGPWDSADWPRAIGLHVGSPLVGVVAGAVAGGLGRLGRGTVTGVVVALLTSLLVVLCTVVDLDQIGGVGLCWLLTGCLAGAAGGAIGRRMRPSRCTGPTPRTASPIPEQPSSDRPPNRSIE